MQSLQSENNTAVTTSSWTIKLLYDGQCPLCLREVAFLSRKDSGRGIVAFVDIADLDYNPSDHGGIGFAEAMGRIHAILPNGTILRDVEVFQRVYEALGIGWMYAPTKWPVLRPAIDRLYRLWANWRLALTGRPNLATLLAERQMHLDQCGEGRCRLIPVAENRTDKT
jgi:predicted DCC family thiol-disulfide oxidoreductase YuxK